MHGVTLEDALQIYHTSTVLIHSSYCVLLVLHEPKISIFNFPIKNSEVHSVRVRYIKKIPGFLWRLYGPTASSQKFTEHAEEKLPNRCEIYFSHNCVNQTDYLPNSRRAL